MSVWLQEIKNLMFERERKGSTESCRYMAQGGYISLLNIQQKFHKKIFFGKINANDKPMASRIEREIGNGKMNARWALPLNPALAITRVVHSVDRPSRPRCLMHV